MKENKLRIEAARNHVQAERFDEALKLFEAVLQDDPETAAAYIGIGNILMRKGQHREAEDYYQGALHVASNRAPVLAMIAKSAEKQGDSERAIKLHNDALAIDGRFERARLSLARLYTQSKRFEEAEEHLQQALRYNPQSQLAATMLAKVRQRLGKTGEAVEGLNQALAGHRADSPRPNMLLGRLQLRSGALEDAVKTLSRSVKECPDDARLESDLGAALLGTKDFDKAIHALERALQLKPDLVPAKLKLAEAHFGAGNTEQAANLLNDMASGGKGLAQVHLLLGRVFVAEGQHHHALQEFAAGFLHAPKLLERFPRLAEIQDASIPDAEKAGALAQALAELPEIRHQGAEPAH